MSKTLYLLCILAIAALSSCKVGKVYVAKDYTGWEKGTPPDSTKLKFQVFLIGDVGEPTKDEQEPSLKLLQQMLDSAGENSSVVFLGDNIYNAGLPDTSDNSRKDMERKINAQLDVVKDYKGKPFFVPGNHDWGFQLPAGHVARIKREDVYIEEYLGRKDVFLPKDGCPGPVAVPLAKDLVLILIDSQWWLQKGGERPIGAGSVCGVEDEVDFTVQLQDVIKRNNGKNIIIAAHHPLITSGSHNGYVEWKTHLFPLTYFNDKLFVPIPILGTIYGFGRAYGVTRQDIPNPVYQQFIRSIMSAIGDQENVIYAAGHEHTMQYYNIGQHLHHIVSGAGCKTTITRKTRQLGFGTHEQGFANVKYYDNGEVWVEYWTTADGGATGELLFRVPLYSFKTIDIAARDTVEDFKDSTYMVAPEPDFAGGKFKYLMLGHHYRSVWAAPVKFKALDMKRFAGGLTPDKKGGGMQTLSLRLRGKDGHEYQVRSINKDPSAVLPTVFQRTFLETVFKDQVSATHPYAAVTLPKMLTAAGIYHPRPQIVYVPYTAQLGTYLNQFGGVPAIIEMRPSDNMTDVDNFGNPEDGKSTSKVYENLLEDNDNEVDQRAFVRVRMFDIFINDWDRHEDQWRWGEFSKKDGKGKIYRPIPRDRDNAYFKFDGFLTWFVNRRYGVRKFKNFGPKIKDVVGLNYNARNIDHNLLTEMTEADWVAEAKHLQTTLTDSIIEASLREMPDTAYKLSGEEILTKLKARRGQLDKVASQYYKFLARRVDVQGSDKHEKFVVERLNNKETLVKIYKISKEGVVQNEIYSRVFKRSETKEIRLYGHGGKDEFELKGKVRKGILITIIGGSGKDTVRNESIVKGAKRKTRYYDNKGDDNYVQGKEVAKHLSNDHSVNNFDPVAIEYDKTTPLIAIEYSRDEGVFLGGGAQIVKQGWRKAPYASKQRITVSTAFKTTAVRFVYSGEFIKAIKSWNLKLDAWVYYPQNVRNYFGLGNNTPGEVKDIDFYRIKQYDYYLSLLAGKKYLSYIDFYIGPFAEVERYQPLFNTIVTANEASVTPRALDLNVYSGGKVQLWIHEADNMVNPTRGISWRTEYSYHQRLKPDISNFSKLKSDFAFYYTPPKIPFQITLALRVGGAVNFGDYYFHQAPTLGGDYNLRGFRQQRFAGKANFYHNADLRIKLFDFNSIVLNGTVGIMAFNDVGRVWQPGEPGAKQWHDGYGGGVWFYLFKMAVINAQVEHSKEFTGFRLDFGFFF